jgi:FKBP-type peptidyl-prolyl cis-trans isomerase
LLGSEKAFDSNTDPEFRHQEPFTVTLGTGGVIKGWDEGLALLSKGTKATLYIPSALGYGPQDRSPQIPSNSILVFDVEITKISTKEAMEKEAAAKSKGQNDVDDKLIKEYAAKNKLKTIKTASGLHYVITKPGQGPKPQPGDKVMVKYNGTFLDGNKFDGNMDRTEPFTFELGKGMVIKGWDEGIALLNKGAKATLLIPSYIAYGAQARGPIPANAVLVFDVELEDFQKK